jgi:hypothetical protein
VTSRWRSGLGRAFYSPSFCCQLCACVRMGVVGWVKELKLGQRRGGVDTTCKYTLPVFLRTKSYTAQNRRTSRGRRPNHRINASEVCSDSCVEWSGTGPVLYRHIYELCALCTRLPKPRFNFRVSGSGCGCQTCLKSGLSGTNGCDRDWACACLYVH